MVKLGAKSRRVDRRVKKHPARLKVSDYSVPDPKLNLDQTQEFFKSCGKKAPGTRARAKTICKPKFEKNDDVMVGRDDNVIKEEMTEPEAQSPEKKEINSKLAVEAAVSMAVGSLSAIDASGVAHIQIPEKASFVLNEKWRYKVLEGGRDAIKSWSVVRCALIRAIMIPTRILCCRELMTSVEESIYQLLVDQIDLMGLRYFFDVKTTEILGRKGTSAYGSRFAFAGLRHNVDEIKSYEGFDIAIVEEAKNVSRSSWDTLVFTIRKEGSEIWIIFNPDLEDDETFQRFVVNPPPGAKVVHFTWRDNPWPSKVLEPEREKMRIERPDDFENIWEGRPRKTLQDAIYAEELRAAERDNHITRVPYDPSIPVHTYWDLGYGNHTSIWFAQKCALEWHVIGYMQNAGKLIGWYVTEMQKLGYVWGTDFLPHDGKNNQLVGHSVEKQLEKLGRSVIVLPQDKGDTGIQAVRTIFPMVYFDREKCAEGLQCLRHYRWARNEEGVITSRKPVHDEYSDGASAFKTFALSRYKKPKGDASRTRVPRSLPPPPPKGPGAWMGS